MKLLVYTIETAIDSPLRDDDSTKAHNISFFGIGKCYEVYKLIELLDSKDPYCLQKGFLI